MSKIIEVLATELANKQKVVTFKPNSVFDALLSEGANDTNISVISSRICTNVVAEVTTIKNKLVPLLTDYTAKAKELLASLKYVGEINKYTIKEVCIDSMADELVRTKYVYSDIKSNDFPTTGIAASIPEDIRSYFKCNITTTVNIKGDELVEKTSDDELKRIWSLYVSNLNASNVYLKTLRYDSLAKLDTILLLIVLLSYLKDNKPNDVSVSDQAYTNGIKGVMNELYFCVQAAIKDYELFNKQQRLVVTVVRDGANETFKACAYIMPEVYEEYLKVGKPEAILGYMQSSNVGTGNEYLKTMVEKTEQFINIWNNNIKADNIAAVRHMTANCKVLYSLMHEKFFKEMLPADLVPVCIPETPNAYNAINEFVNTKSDSEIMDIDYMAKEIFGNIYFIKTNFLRFVNYINEFCKLFPNLSTAELANYAALSMVCDYLISQLDANVIGTTDD